MNIFFEIHKDIPREGPGDNESTRKAFSLLGQLPKNARALDIGCGPGMQTIELGKHLDGHIHAIDVHEPFLEHLREQSKIEGLSEKITAQKGSMFDLEFDQEYFDLIWSEGAIFIMGFKQGINAWYKHLKKGGYLVVSEISWLRSETPLEALNYWKPLYPYIKGIADNINILEKSGYVSVGHYILPESAWWDNYYTPLIERINLLREKYKGDIRANQQLDSTMKEIEFYRKYSDFYGYVFYIMKKI